MPTPRVSVPQMTASSPAWARVSTSRRYFGSIPAWCTPMPCSTSRRRVAPKPLPNRKPPTASLIAALRADETMSTLVEGLGLLDGRGLREGHDVDRRAVVAQQQLERLVHGGEHPRELQRHRPFRPGDGHGLAAGAAGQVLLEGGRVAEGRRHEEELRVRHEEQRHLPGPAAVGLGVEVELVHDDEPDVGELTVAQGVVGEHLGRRADDRRPGVHGGVAGEHPDVAGAEDLHEGEELLAHQGLDRRGVPAAPALGEGLGVRCDRDERLPRARRRREHDVRTAGQGQHRLLLRGVEREPPLTGPVEEDVEGRVRAGGGGAGEAVGEGHRRRFSPTGGRRRVSRAARCWPPTPAARAR